MHFDLFDEGDVLAARPTPLDEVRPQLGVQRHTAEQIIETFVPVQVLDAPVPQMGEVQVVEFMQQFDAPVVAEPVIDVPKISLDQTRRRMGDYLRPPQTAEQLLEVPTIVSFSSLQRAVEQYGDIPVPHGCGGLGGEGGFQGFSPGQGSAAYSGAEFVGIPVPGRGWWRGSREGLQCACPGLNSTVRSVEQIVEIPVLHGAPPDFHQDPLLSAGSSDLLDLANQGVFRTRRLLIWTLMGR